MATKGKGKGKGGKAGADDLNAIDEKEMYAAKVWTLQSKLGMLIPYSAIEQERAHGAMKSENELRSKVKDLQERLEEERKNLFKIT